MVNNAATFGRSGVHDFVLIRGTAIVLATYSLFIACFFFTTPEITFDVWRGFFANLGVKVYTLMAIIAVLIHAWIGLWQVLSDYVKPAFLRGVLQLVFAITLLAYFAAGVLTLWSV